MKNIDFKQFVLVLRRELQAAWKMLAAYAACHARKQELRALINAAQTEEELDEIVITWPV